MKKQTIPVQEEILALLCRENKGFSVPEIAKHFSVSQPTIRQLVYSLIENGLLKEGSYLHRRGRIYIPVCNRENIMSQIPFKTTIVLPVADKIVKLIDFWLDKDGLAGMDMPRKDDDGNFLNPPKAFSRLVTNLEDLFRGRFLLDKAPVAKFFGVEMNQRFSDRDIRRSINNFHLAVTNAEYAPYDKTSLKKIGFNHFIWNPYIPQEEGEKRMRCLFLEYFLNPPPLLQDGVPLPTTQVPILAMVLRQKYAETFCGGDSEHFTPMDERYFIQAANKLSERMVIWREKANMDLGSNRISGSLMEYLEGASLKQVNPKLLTFDWIYNNFAVFLKKKGAIY